MDFENKVLSDVHVNTVYNEVKSDERSYAVSRFSFHILQDKCQRSENRSPCEEAKSDASIAVETDEDGDLIVTRKKQPSKDDVEIITIEHALATELNDVGQQVWQGALLLCDFMLACWEVFRGTVVLDLGAGVGLTSVLAALQASHVFCTDHGTSVLELALRNAQLNSHLLGPGAGCSLRVRELDWFWDWQKGEFPSAPEDTPQHFSWSKDDLEILEKTSIIIASEVVYDYDLTDAFFRTLHYFLKSRPRTAYIALEKRLVFSASELSVCSPGYEQFCENLDALQELDMELEITYSQVTTDFPQAFSYHRHRLLELWKVQSSVKSHG